MEEDHTRVIKEMNAFLPHLLTPTRGERWVSDDSELNLPFPVDFSPLTPFFIEAQQLMGAAFSQVAPYDQTYFLKHMLINEDDQIGHFGTWTTETDEAGVERLNNIVIKIGSDQDGCPVCECEFISRCFGFPADI
jgi:hypothetical protein